MQPPKIIIIGEPKSGKTFLSAWVEKALQEQGFMTQVIEEKKNASDKELEMQSNTRSNIVKNDIRNFLYSEKERIVIEIHKTLSKKTKGV